MVCPFLELFIQSMYSIQFHSFFPSLQQMVSSGCNTSCEWLAESLLHYLSAENSRQSVSREREFCVILHLSVHNESRAYVLGEHDNYLSSYSFKRVCIGTELDLNTSMQMAGWLKAVRTTVGSWITKQQKSRHAPVAVRVFLLCVKLINFWNMTLMFSSASQRDPWTCCFLSAFCGGRFCFHPEEALYCFPVRADVLWLY